MGRTEVVEETEGLLSMLSLVWLLPFALVWLLPSPDLEASTVLIVDSVVSLDEAADPMEAEQLVGVLTWSPVWSVER